MLLVAVVALCILTVGHGFVHRFALSVYSKSFFSSGHILLIAYRKQKMNVFRIANPVWLYLIDPKMAIFQASIFGYRFRTGLQKKRGSIFR